jgi:hypothetical protein
MRLMKGPLLGPSAMKDLQLRKGKWLLQAKAREHYAGKVRRGIRHIQEITFCGY